MSKKSKKSPALSHEYPTRERLNELLKKASSAQDDDKNSELLYQLEKYGRELANDEDQKVAAYHFKRAVKEFQDMTHAQQDRTQELYLLISSGQTYATLGLTQDAETSYEQALQLSTDLTMDLLKARTLRLLGNLKLQQTDSKAAIKYFEQSIDLCQQTGEPLEEAYSLNSLAAAYFQKAAWRKMETACEQALAIAEKLDENELAGCAYNNLGAMYSLRGQKQKALIAFQKCLPLFEMAGDQRGLAEAYNNMATLYRDQDMWHDAGKCYSLSIQFSDRVGDVLAKANAMLNRVELYILMYDLELARENCIKSMQTFYQLGYKFGEADACKLMGVIYTKEEQWELAAKYFDESVEINLSSANAFGLAETYKSYADYFVARGQNDQAFEMLENAKEQFRKVKATQKVRQIDKLVKSLQS